MSSNETVEERLTALEGDAVLAYVDSELTDLVARIDNLESEFDTMRTNFEALATEDTK